ncbi:hypothetical protein CSC14_0675 [Proteus mirabilis]|nr:hypothetical protein CSC16_2448 [Proteus mirabilis]PVF71351.1 hypothetical protein CSC14_0675 [Proteus mirabilis]
MLPGGFKNIALIVFQCFQPRSNITFVLNLSDNPQIRHQEHASQLGDQLFKCIIFTAKSSFHFAVQATFAIAPVNNLMQIRGIKASGIGKKRRSGNKTSSVDGMKKAFCPFSMMLAPLLQNRFSACGNASNVACGATVSAVSERPSICSTLNTTKVFSIGIWSISPVSFSFSRMV